MTQCGTQLFHSSDSKIYKCVLDLSFSCNQVSYESVSVGLFTILQCKLADDPTGSCPGPDRGHEVNQVFAGWSRNG